MSSNNSVLKSTPLFDLYENTAGVKLMDFGGWNLPLSFSTVAQEHQAVREEVGMFDVSHMGEFLVTGENAEAFLDYAVTSKPSDLSPGSCLYSPVCRPDGGTVDDILVYRLEKERFMLVVNGSNISKDFTWFTRDMPWQGSRPSIEDQSDLIGLIAVQGPLALKTLQPLFQYDLNSIAYYTFQDKIKMKDAGSVLISRTGYTGEDGYEIYADPETIRKVWVLLEGKITLCGLGARDTLRIEARLPLYGHELSDTISPLESGLKRFVDLEKESFCGKEVLETQQQNKPSRRLYGLQMIDKAVPRQGHKVSVDGRQIGEVTSGTKSPTLGSFIGMALLERGSVKRDNEVILHLERGDKKAEIVKLPFYRRG